MSRVSDIKLIRTDFFFLEILFSQCAKGHTLHHYLQCYKKVLRVISGLQLSHEVISRKTNGYHYSLFSSFNNNNLRFLETHIKTLCVNNKIKCYE